LLTLLIVAVVITQVVRGREVESLWTETLLIALAHYFTSRRFINLAPEAMRRLDAENQVETEANPLYLPRHTIRAVLILAFVGLAVYLHRHDQLLQPPALSILGVVFPYHLPTLPRVLPTRRCERRARGIQDIPVAASIHASSRQAFQLRHFSRLGRERLQGLQDS
jgi:hypothetical protein